MIPDASDASLPPADVQRPEPLTEKELANLQGLADLFPDHHIVPVAAGRLKLLIADLRAEREEHVADRRTATEVMMRQAADLRASRAEATFQAHLADHGCHRATGFAYCDEAMRLFEAIPEDYRGVLS